MNEPMKASFDGASVRADSEAIEASTPTVIQALAETASAIPAVNSRNEAARHQTQPASHTQSTRKDWLLRGIVYGVLAVLLGLAGYDFYIKRQFEQSQKNLMTIRRDKEYRHETITKDDVETNYLVGNPEEVDSKNDNSGYVIKIYKWKGPFRTYRIQARYRDATEPKLLGWTALEEDFVEEKNED